jgi:cell division septal protein FtsQ
MVGSAIQSVRHRRRKKHPYRRFVLILTGAALVIGLFYLWMYMRSSSPASAPAVSGDDNSSVQFK